MPLLRNADRFAPAPMNGRHVLTATGAPHRGIAAMWSGQWHRCAGVLQPVGFRERAVA